MKYWKWWYKNNKKVLETIEMVLIPIGGIVFIGLLGYGMILLDEHLQSSIPQSRDITTLEGVIAFVSFIVIVLLIICLNSYRKYKKENLTGV